MTWNIHGALDRNPRFELDRVVVLVKAHAPDIVALQEVDSRRVRAPGEDSPFDILQSMLGSHGIRAHAVTTADGDYGQMLISRWPLRNTEIHDLSYGAREPRRAISSDVETPAGCVHVIATHLGLSFHERRRQAAALLKMTAKGALPTIVMGDFNDWMWPGSVRSQLARVLPGYTRHRTFPSKAPLFRLDRIYLRPRTALVASKTDLEARRISDHLPVIVDLAVG